MFSQTEKCFYLVTEYVEPLQFVLNNFSSNNPNSKQQKDLSIAWGLFQVTVIYFSLALSLSNYSSSIRLYLFVTFGLLQRALSFLNNDGNLQHNSVCLGSILVNTAGGKYPEQRNHLLLTSRK